MFSFFWKENNEKGKKKLAALKKICILVEEGGLGVRDLSEAMKALHMKFVWRLQLEDNLWSNFAKQNTLKETM